jgi:hypothetical protein
MVSIDTATSRQACHENNAAQELTLSHRFSTLHCTVASCHCIKLLLQPDVFSFKQTDKVNASCAAGNLLTKKEHSYTRTPQPTRANERYLLPAKALANARTDYDPRGGSLKAIVHSKNRTNVLVH